MKRACLLLVSLICLFALSACAQAEESQEVVVPELVPIPIKEPIVDPVFEIKEFTETHLVQHTSVSLPQYCYENGAELLRFFITNGYSEETLYLSVRAYHENLMPLEIRESILRFSVEDDSGKIYDSITMKAPWMFCTISRCFVSDYGIDILVNMETGRNGIGLEIPLLLNYANGQLKEIPLDDIEAMRGVSYSREKNEKVHLSLDEIGYTTAIDTNCILEDDPIYPDISAGPLPIGQYDAAQLLMGNSSDKYDESIEIVGECFLRADGLEAFAYFVEEDNTRFRQYGLRASYVFMNTYPNHLGNLYVDYIYDGASWHPISMQYEAFE
ncbi:hypothetical protein LJC55_03910 [Eubacteriales bacterium OttesenSCG-928-N14]|nr:hypothetical protein [Eubacteriales bacterium OttesenSCG-928-N14]